MDDFNIYLDRVVDEAVKVDRFKYNPNDVYDELAYRSGALIKPGKYGPKRSGGRKPILLVFGIWDRSNRIKYRTNENLLVGIDIGWLSKEDIVKIAGPKESGKWLKTIMDKRDAKSRYNAFHNIMDKHYGAGYAQKVLHDNPPYSTSDNGNINAHGSWRTYISSLTSNSELHNVSPEKFIDIAARLKFNKDVKSDESFHDIVQSKYYPDLEIDWYVEPEKPEPEEEEIEVKPNIDVNFDPAELGDIDIEEEPEEEPEEDIMEYEPDIELPVLAFDDMELPEDDKIQLRKKLDSRIEDEITQDMATEIESELDSSVVDSAAEAIRDMEDIEEKDIEEEDIQPSDMMDSMLDAIQDEPELGSEAEPESELGSEPDELAESRYRLYKKLIYE